jgi:hypothetical protein
MAALACSLTGRSRFRGFALRPTRIQDRKNKMKDSVLPVGAL